VVITPHAAMNMTCSFGETTAKSSQAEKLIAGIRSSLNEINRGPGDGTRVLYLFWRDPWMGAATNTFIHEMLTVAGFEHCLKDQERYPELALIDLTTLNPDLVFLSSEPYPFSEKHVEEIQLLFPNAKILLVDGEMFSWYGSRMRYFANYLATLPSS